MGDFFINRGQIVDGVDLKINGLTIKNPTVDEILNIDDTHSGMLYNIFIAELLCDPYDNMVMLDDMGYDFCKVEPFDVFLIKWENYKKNNNTAILNEALKFFIGDYSFETLTVKNEKVIGVFEYNNFSKLINIINKETFNIIFEFIFAINFFSKKDRINIDPNDITARMVLLEDKRYELKKKRKSKDIKESFDYFGKLISLVCNGNGSGITYFNKGNLKISQLLDACTTRQKFNNKEHLLQGVYTGNLKYDSIKKELDWIG